MKKVVLVFALTLASIAYAGNTVPFHATVDTQVTPGPLCAPACVNIFITGIGDARHMGNMSIEGPSRISFISGVQTGTSRMTAADGSTMLISFSGIFVPGSGPGDGTSSGSWTMLSGTGRFAGESGGGTFDVVATGNTGVLNIDGTLSNPGKK